MSNKEIIYAPYNPLVNQVGGQHYKRNVLNQPIHFIHDNDLSFNQGNVVKYISRYKDKNGVEDIKKVIHYTLIEAFQNLPNAEFNSLVDWLRSQINVEASPQALKPTNKAYYDRDDDFNDLRIDSPLLKPYLQPSRDLEPTQTAQATYSETQTGIRDPSLAKPQLETQETQETQEKTRPRRSPRPRYPMLTQPTPIGENKILFKVGSCIVGNPEVITDRDIFQIYEINYASETCTIRPVGDLRIKPREITLKNWRLATVGEIEYGLRDDTIVNAQLYPRG